ncbi:MAG: pyrroline-5-carboxylate reductase [Candidatus Omnitrophica bacterium]|nr:pyrroline-5-carboxylate reductase [Candidatus Omnitrophota bacterium]
MKNIGIIGGGNMGEALIKGLHKSHNVHVCEVNPERVNFLKNRYKAFYEQDISSLVAKVNIIILAVKPQEMESVLGQLKSSKDKLFISIAAGLTTKYFEDRLGEQARVIRAMPNLPALNLEGITGFCAGRFVNEGDKGNTTLILEALGKGFGSVIPFEESQMDAVTAVSGSGPAYVFFFVEEWIKAAMTLGLSEKDARVLVCETLIGSAGLLKQLRSSEFEELTTLRAKVISKGGTTQAAMEVFLGRKFDQMMKDALLAAKKRAKELAK